MIDSNISLTILGEVRDTLNKYYSLKKIELYSTIPNNNYSEQKTYPYEIICRNIEKRASLLGTNSSWLYNHEKTYIRRILPINYNGLKLFHGFSKRDILKLQELHVLAHIALIFDDALSKNELPQLQQVGPGLKIKFTKEQKELFANHHSAIRVTVDDVELEMELYAIQVIEKLTGEIVKIVAPEKIDKNKQKQIERITEGRITTEAKGRRRIIILSPSILYELKKFGKCIQDIENSDKEYAFNKNKESQQTYTFSHGPTS